MQRFWRKAGILTADKETDLENDISRATVSNKSKVISDMDCEELWASFSHLKAKT
jgi:hypothetical protein